MSELHKTLEQYRKQLTKTRSIIGWPKRDVMYIDSDDGNSVKRVVYDSTEGIVVSMEEYHR